MSKFKNPSKPGYLLNVFSGGIFKMAKSKVAKGLASIVLILYAISFVGGAIMNLLGFHQDNFLIFGVLAAILLIRFFIKRSRS